MACMSPHRKQLKHVLIVRACYGLLATGCLSKFHLYTDQHQAASLLL
jgi:hypothetical protein